MVLRLRKNTSFFFVICGSNYDLIYGHDCGITVVEKDSFQCRKARRLKSCCPYKISRKPPYKAASFFLSLKNLNLW